MLVTVPYIINMTRFFLHQIYDTGKIEGSFGSFNVTNVQVFAGYVLHMGSFTKGSKALSVGDKVACKVTLLVIQSLHQIS